MTQIIDELLEAVQTAEVFKDAKEFVDAIPKTSPEAILKAFNEQKSAPDFDLKAFILAHYELPVDHVIEDSSAHPTMREHIDAMWSVLLRSMPQSQGTLIGLPHPHVVPGGRFREIYYWDSYFVAEGLMRANQLSIVMGMIENFAYLIKTYGFIPNGNRTYYLSRSQIPYFGHLLALVKDHQGMDAILPYYEALKAEYHFWMDGAEDVTEVKPRIKHCVLVDDGIVLNRFWDNENTPRPEAFSADRKIFEQAAERNQTEFYRNIRAASESGWDFSSRWLGDHKNLSTIRTCDIIPVDLNSQLHMMEALLADMSKAKGDIDASLQFDRAANVRKKAIMRYFWNEEKGFFFDYDFKAKELSKSWCLAGVQPLFVRLVTQEQSDQIAENLAHRFLQAGGLATTLQRSSQQWDLPNGWAPLQWVAVQGLLAYNHIELAKDIASHWLDLNKAVFKSSHKMLEKYNVVDASSEAAAGEYAMQEGFGWTNAVALGFIDLLNASDSH
ncbi:MAG: trehalase [Chlamydiales bacterium]|nr:trehalase [Chlamydiales bacterium]